MRGYFRHGTMVVQMQGAHEKEALGKESLQMQTLSTVLEVAPNLLKFPLTALYGAPLGGVFCIPVPIGALFAPTQGLQF